MKKKDFFLVSQIEMELTSTVVNWTCPNFCIYFSAVAINKKYYSQNNLCKILLYHLIA